MSWRQSRPNDNRLGSSQGTGTHVPVTWLLTLPRGILRSFIRAFVAVLVVVALGEQPPSLHLHEIVFVVAEAVEHAGPLRCNSRRLAKVSQPRESDFVPAGSRQCNGQKGQICKWPFSMIVLGQTTHYPR